MNKLISSLKYFSVGLQLVSMVVVPFLLCIFAGIYIQKRFQLGDWVILISILLAMIIMITDIYTFSKKILKNLKKESKGEKHDK